MDCRTSDAIDGFSRLSSLIEGCLRVEPLLLRALETADNASTAMFQVFSIDESNVIDFLHTSAMEVSRDALVIL